MDRGPWRTFSFGNGRDGRYARHSRVSFFSVFFDGASVESNLGRRVDVLGVMSASELRRMRRGLFSHMRMCTMEEGNTTTNRVSVSCEF